MVKLLRLYTDKHIAKAIAVQIRSRGVDIVRCEEVGMGNASDEAHLEYALREGRAIVTHDRDFLRYHKEYTQQGKTHAGIFFISRHLQGEENFGAVIQQLFSYHALILGEAGTVENDIFNQIIWIG